MPNSNYVAFSLHTSKNETNIGNLKFNSVSIDEALNLIKSTNPIISMKQEDFIRYHKFDIDPEKFFIVR